MAKNDEESLDVQDRLVVDELSERTHLEIQFYNVTSHFVAAENLMSSSILEDSDRKASTRKVKLLLNRLSVDSKHYAIAYNELTKAVNKVEDRAAKAHHRKSFEDWLKTDQNRFLGTLKRKTDITVADFEFLIEELKVDVADSLVHDDPELETSQERIPDPSDVARVEESRIREPSHSEAQASSRLPRLPSLPLPVFSGDNLEFHDWYERFEEMVHARTDISDSEKMSYLLACVQGVAKVALNQFPVTANGYASAITLLRDSFGAKDSDERALASQIECLSATSSSWQDQLSLVLTLKALVARMERLREGVHGDMILQEIITRKFPPQLKDLLHRFSYNSKKVTVKALLDKAEEFVREELFVASMNGSANKLKAAVSKQVVNAVRDEADSRKDQPKLTEFSSANSSTKCVYCGKHKFSYDCYTLRRVIDRIEFLKKRGLCMACLRPTRTVHRCDVKCPICEKEHDLSACMQFANMTQPRKDGKVNSPTRQKFRMNRNTTNPQGRESGEQKKGRHMVMASQFNETNRELSHFPRLQTGQVIVEGKAPSFYRRVAFLLDTGASISLVSQNLAEELSLRKLRDVESTVCGLGDRTNGPQIYPVYEVPLRSITGRRLSIEAMGFPEPIVGTLNYLPLREVDRSEIRRRKLEMADEGDRSSTINPQLLLGNRDYLMITRVKQHRIYLSSTVLLPSLLGWIATGGEEQDTRKQTVAHVISKSSAMKELKEPLQKFLALEECVKGELDEVETKAFDVDGYFRDNVHIENGKVHTRYCIKEECLDKLSTNWQCAHARMRNVLSSLRSKGMLNAYDEKIKEHLTKSYVEIVKPPSERDRFSYLPHHSVFRVDKPEKSIRIVFDASAKERGKISLNECLRDAQVRLERIPALLLRTRCAHSILLSDVEAAFLQIGISPDQRDFLRFLSLKNVDKPMLDENIVHMRFKVAPFGVSQSPYRLESSIRYHVELTRSLSSPTSDDVATNTVLEQLQENLYVDNFVLECEASTDKRELYRESKRIFAMIGMNLREFSSEDGPFIESLPCADRGKVGMQKVLGMHWCSERDEFALKTNMPVTTCSLTKRSILSKLASTFDPLGLMAPILLPVKLFVQQLWNKNYGWDSPISEEDKQEWLKIENDASTFQHYIPRRFGQNQKGLMLVVFADASAKSMAAVVYVVGESGASVAMARSQLAPLKNKLTIPMLELKAILLAAKLLRFVITSVTKTHLRRVDETHMFSDSTIALHWVEESSTTRFEGIVRS